jgi:hypothetical protein
VRRANGGGTRHKSQGEKTIANESVTDKTATDEAAHGVVLP